MNNLRCAGVSGSSTLRQASAPRPSQPLIAAWCSSAMLAGIGVGSFAWFSILSLSMTALRRRIGQRGLRAADTLAGLGLLGFGGLLGWRTLRTT